MPGNFDHEQADVLSGEASWDLAADDHYEDIHDFYGKMLAQ
jgi:hypothetical protein